MREKEVFENPSYYAILTANVRYDNRLTDSEKILFAEITALSNKYGYCTASNGYFAKLYDVHKMTISKRISNLKKLGYLRSEEVYEEKEIVQRKLYPLADTLIPISANADTPISANAYTPISANAEDNNTSNNITSNNNNILSVSDETDFLHAKIAKEIIDYLNQKTDSRFTTRAKKNIKLIDARLNEGRTVDDFKKVIDHMTNKWTGTEFEQYLCPDTLFSNKFEKYLNMALKQNNKPKPSNPYASIY